MMKGVGDETVVEGRWVGWGGDAEGSRRLGMGVVVVVVVDMGRGYLKCQL